MVDEAAEPKAPESEGEPKAPPEDKEAKKKTETTSEADSEKELTSSVGDLLKTGSDLDNMDINAAQEETSDITNAVQSVESNPGDAVGTTANLELNLAADGANADLDAANKVSSDVTKVANAAISTEVAGIFNDEKMVQDATQEVEDQTKKMTEAPVTGLLDILPDDKPEDKKTSDEKDEKDEKKDDQLEATDTKEKDDSEGSKKQNETKPSTPPDPEKPADLEDPDVARPIWKVTPGTEGSSKAEKPGISLSDSPPAKSDTPDAPKPAGSDDDIKQSLLEIKKDVAETKQNVKELQAGQGQKSPPKPVSAESSTAEPPADTPLHSTGEEAPDAAQKETSDITNAVQSIESNPTDAVGTTANLELNLAADGANADLNAANEVSSNVTKVADAAISTEVEGISNDEKMVQDAAKEAKDQTKELAEAPVTEMLDILPDDKPEDEKTSDDKKEEEKPAPKATEPAKLGSVQDIIAQFNKAHALNITPEDLAKGSGINIGNQLSSSLAKGTPNASTASVGTLNKMIDEGQAVDDGTPKYDVLDKTQHFTPQAETKSEQDEKKLRAVAGGSGGPAPPTPESPTVEKSEEEKKTPKLD